MAEYKVFKNPIRYAFHGNEETARTFVGQGKRILFQLHNMMDVYKRDMGTLSRIFADGTLVRATTFRHPGVTFFTDMIYIKSPFIPVPVEKVIVPEEVVKKVEEEKMLELLLYGLVLQFQMDQNDGPTYPGIYAKLPSVNADKYKYVSYPQDTGINNRYTGNTSNGAIVESKGRYGYGFGVADAIFQIKLGNMEVVSQLELKTNTSTLVHHTFDDKNKILYVAMARDGYGEGYYNSELFKVSTRDAQGNPSLQVHGHIITDENAHIAHLIVNPENNLLYAGIAGKQQIKDTTPDDIKTTFTQTLSAPLTEFGVWIGLDDPGGSCLIPYLVGKDDGAGHIIGALNWPGGREIVGGTVNYTTGQVTVEFKDPVPSGATVYFWASPSQVIIYNAITLAKEGTFLLPASKYAIQGPLSIIDDNDNLIIVTGSSPYVIAKYGAQGNELEQLLLDSAIYPLVFTYGEGKYAYLAGESLVSNYDPNTVVKLDIETMTVAASITIPRTVSNSPHVMSIDIEQNKLYLVNQFKNDIYRISCDDLSYECITNDVINKYPGISQVLPNNWNPFMNEIGQSNRAFYRTEKQVYSKEIL